MGSTQTRKPNVTETTMNRMKLGRFFKAFARGIASIVCVLPPKREDNIEYLEPLLPIREGDDWQAIQSDFHTIGNDLRQAVNQHNATTTIDITLCGEGASRAAGAAQTVTDAVEHSPPETHRRQPPSAR